MMTEQIVDIAPTSLVEVTCNEMLCQAPAENDAGLARIVLAASKIFSRDDLDSQCLKEIVASSYGACLHFLARLCVLQYRHWLFRTAVEKRYEVAQTD